MDVLKPNNWAAKNEPKNEDYKEELNNRPKILKYNREEKKNHS